MNLLLDTCTFIWLCADPDRLSNKAREVLSAAGTIFLSDVVVLEIALKWQARKLELPSPPRAWVEQQAGIWGTTPLSISRPVVYRSCELPPLHRDPFDRLLVATSLEYDVPILTPDRAIQRYPIVTFWDSSPPSPADPASTGG